MEDIDQHLFMMAKLISNNGQEVVILILPDFQTSFVNSAVKENFEAVFNGIRTNFMGGQDQSEIELFQDLKLLEPKQICFLTFLNSQTDSLRKQDYLLFGMDQIRKNGLDHIKSGGKANSCIGYF